MLETQFWFIACKINLLSRGCTASSFCETWIRDRSWPKKKDLWPKFLEGSELPGTNDFRPILTETIKLIKQLKNQANGCSTYSCCSCTEFEDIFLFEIRQKWLSYMGQNSMLKMNKIANILVPDISKVVFAQIAFLLQHFSFCPHFKCKMHIYTYPENFRQKYRKM